MLDYPNGNGENSQEESSSNLEDFDYATVDGANYVLEQIKEKFIPSSEPSELENKVKKKSDQTKL